jgi:hypothetical protein
MAGDSAVRGGREATSGIGARRVDREREAGVQLAIAIGVNNYA